MVLFYFPFYHLKGPVSVLICSCLLIFYQDKCVHVHQWSLSSHTVESHQYILGGKNEHRQAAQKADLKLEKSV